MRSFQMRAVSVLLGAASVIAPEGASAQGGSRLPAPEIGSAFDLEVKTVMAGGIRLAYVEQGSGTPVVFIHGNPTSKYLWRNVIPHVADGARAIALDLPGMGDSERPNEPFRYIRQVETFAAFVDALGLRNIVLVVHDWGAAIGFDYARLNPGNVRGIAFMEGVLPPVFPQPSYEAMGEEIGGMFRALRDPEMGRKLVFDDHMFVEQVLPGFVNRTLGAAEMTEYRRPYRERANRDVILMWPREIPIAGEPAAVVRRMEEIRDFMGRAPHPMLLLYAEPGTVVTAPVVEAYTRLVRNLETTFVGQGLHFIQEDQPVAIGRAVRDWIRRHGWRAGR